MTYVQGFIVPVRTEAKEAYRAFAEAAVPMFREHGFDRMVECWEDDVPDGKVTDLRRAVALADGEQVVVSWIDYADKAALERFHAGIIKDERMEAMGPMPFDGARMVYGGFEPLVDIGTLPAGIVGGGIYVDASCSPVPFTHQDAFAAGAARMADVFVEHGACRVFEGWGDGLEEGKQTSFRRAVAATEEENVVFSFIAWPSRQARDAGWAKVIADPRAKPDADGPLFDMKRMIFGGFRPIVDADGAAA